MTTTLEDCLARGEVDLGLRLGDGTELSFRATAHAQLIGEPAATGIPGRRRMGLITAWDLDAGLWRAFKPTQVETWFPR